MSDVNKASLRLDYSPVALFQSVSLKTHFTWCYWASVLVSSHMKVLLKWSFIWVTWVLC